jgi:hypothetical protein
MNQMLISMGLAMAVGVLIIYSRRLWEQVRFIKMRRKRYKSAQYRAVIDLMHKFLHFEKEIEQSYKYYPYRVPADVLHELRERYNNMLLYAPKGVLMAMRNFMISPDHHYFLVAALAMRKDFWGDTVSVKVEEVAF